MNNEVRIEEIDGRKVNYINAYDIPPEDMEKHLDTIRTEILMKKMDESHE